MLKICFHSFCEANTISSALFKGIAVIDILDKLKRQRFHYRLFNISLFGAVLVERNEEVAVVHFVIGIKFHIPIKRSTLCSNVVWLNYVYV